MTDDLARFTRTIELRLGLRIEPERAASMIELIARRAAVYREPTANYVVRVETDREELRALSRELTVGETYFFRHVEQFNAFAHVVLPERLAARTDIAVLSAGCSTGEEPYSLAMLVRERVPEPSRVAIHAIDVNPSALARAARGQYSRWALRSTLSDVEARWFQTEGREVVVSPAIRTAVTFEERNLIDDGDLWAPDRWDAIFCRNVVMYFTESRAREVIARMIRSLAPGGYLFMGHAETVRDRSDLELCHTHGTFYYQRKPGTVRPSELAPTSTSPSHWVADIQASSERIHALVDAAQPTPAPAQPLVRARQLLGEERFAEALEHLAPALATDRDARLLSAIAYMHTGRFVDAEAACRQVLEGGELAGAHYVLALCRESAGDNVGAVSHAQLASVLDPSFAMARLHLGLLARRAGDRRTAGDQLARAIVLLERETPDRLELYGGGFGRRALVEMCRAELAKAAS